MTLQNSYFSKSMFVTFNEKVHCEKTGTIYYTDGTIRRWSHKAVLKSLEQREKNVFQLAIQNK